jgi:multimeric flavodoxin WrbA
MPRRVDLPVLTTIKGNLSAPGRLTVALTALTTLGSASFGGTALVTLQLPSLQHVDTFRGQTSDWMAEIYPRWVAAHGVAIITPTYYYQAPATLKLMIDRMVCSDGGNPDPTATHGKGPAKAKAVGLAGWGFPKHLAGRAFAIFVHDDASGTESLRRNLHDWLTDMALVSSGPKGNLDRFIGYIEPYASSHEALDKTPALVEEVRMTMGALVEKIAQLRAGVKPIGAELQDPRPK